MEFSLSDFRSYASGAGLLLDLFGFILIAAEYRLAVKSGVSRSQAIEREATWHPTIPTPEVSLRYDDMGQQLHRYAVQQHNDKQESQQRRTIEARGIIEDLSERARYFWAAGALVLSGFTLQFIAVLPASVLIWMGDRFQSALPVGQMHVAMLSGLDWFGLAVVIIASSEWFTLTAERQKAHDARREIQALTDLAKRSPAPLAFNDRIAYLQEQVALWSARACAIGWKFGAGVGAIAIGSLPWRNASLAENLLAMISVN